LQTQETIEQSMPKSLFLNFIKNTQFSELKQFEQDHFSMQEYYNISQQVISLGKSAQESLQTLEMKIKNKQLESQHKKSILEQEIKNLTDQKNTLLNQSQQIKKTIEDFENNISTQATYHCEKI
jgi:translation initiation factor 2B subunit (eIF-2B alpha/beta/delta family)